MESHQKEYFFLGCTPKDNPGSFVEVAKKESPMLGTGLGSGRKNMPQWGSPQSS